MSAPSKTAIVILSDPASGSQEALGRLFNALFLAYELHEKGRQPAVIFQGAGTRWVTELMSPTHPAHALFQAVQKTVVGACGGCADVFGATAGVEASGVAIVREKAIPGTTGIADLSKYLDEGYHLVTF
ncbi:MAG: DsrE family protein [Vicinamibacterales bacterium]